MYDSSLTVSLNQLPSLILTQRQLCDLECIMMGAFSPLEGFMDEQDYKNCINEMRLMNGQFWPMPIVLDVPEKFSQNLSLQDKVLLKDSYGMPLAILNISSIYQPNKLQEAESIYGTDSKEHPGVDYLFSKIHAIYLGGKLSLLNEPFHADFKQYRLKPEELKAYFKENHFERIVAFQTRNPLHRAHYELTLRAAKEYKAHLLIQPSVGETKPGDIDHFTRVRCYQKALQKYSKNFASLSLLPLAMRMAGPREALWHAIIRKNYGCTHFIIGRDHAGPGKDSQGKHFYPPEAAKKLALQHQEKLGLTIVPFAEMVYSKKYKTYKPATEIEENEEILELSGTEQRQRLREGKNIPEWFAFPEVVEELRKAFPPASQQGFTVFFTGLSGAGKSTLAHLLIEALKAETERAITLLDGDEVRKLLSSELGFSKEHRDLNILRIGYVASEVTKHRGIAICAPIAPYENTRNAVRKMVEPHGTFIEIYVATPLSVCEKRDTKGLYQKARQGLIKQFTGIDDPYETPSNPELIINTENLNLSQCLENMMNLLKAKKLIVK